MAHEGGSHLKSYLAVFLSLMGLTALTVYVAFFDLGVMGTPVAVGIACVKATLVILFFMHVRYETRLIGMYAASGFGMLLILFTITMGEYFGRDPRPQDPLTPNAAAAQEVPLLR